MAINLIDPYYACRMERTRRELRCTSRTGLAVRKATTSRTAQAVRESASFAYRPEHGHDTEHMAVVVHAIVPAVAMVLAAHARVPAIAVVLVVNAMVTASVAIAAHVMCTVHAATPAERLVGSAPRFPGMSFASAVGLLWQRLQKGISHVVCVCIERSVENAAAAGAVAAFSGAAAVAATAYEHVAVDAPTAAAAFSGVGAAGSPAVAAGCLDVAVDPAVAPVRSDFTDIQVVIPPRY